MIKLLFVMRLLFSVSVIFLIAFSGCAVKRAIPVSPEGVGSVYESRFPSANASGALELISRSVKKVYSISSYRTWQFRREARITGYHVMQGKFKQAAWGVLSTNETVFGTATVAGMSGTSVALLTCAHVVTSPDTVMSFFDPAGDDPVSYLKSFSVKEKQENWVRDLSSCGSFTILASDPANDIAIIGKKCEGLADTVTTFSIPAGRAKDLSWGSFVYLMGYPMGNQVITSGIVSPARKRPMGEFSADALLNKGCSGGIILAVRRGVPDFELVGMVKNVSSTVEEFLKPAPDRPRSAEWLPYDGAAYAGSREEIQYGLNSVVTIETIAGFYSRNRQALLKQGYDLDCFFGVKKP